jgi:hypothetical protein
MLPPGETRVHTSFSIDRVNRVLDVDYYYLLPSTTVLTDSLEASTGQLLALPWTSTSNTAD